MPELLEVSMIASVAGEIQGDMRAAGWPTVSVVVDDLGNWTAGAEDYDWERGWLKPEA